MTQPDTRPNPDGQKVQIAPFETGAARRPAGASGVLFPDIRAGPPWIHTGDGWPAAASTAAADRLRRDRGRQRHGLRSSTVPRGLRSCLPKPTASTQRSGKAAAHTASGRPTTDGPTHWRPPAPARTPGKTGTAARQHLGRPCACGATVWHFHAGTCRQRPPTYRCTVTRGRNRCCIAGMASRITAPACVRLRSVTSYLPPPKGLRLIVLATVSMCSPFVVLWPCARRTPREYSTKRPSAEKTFARIRTHSTPANIERDLRRRGGLDKKTPEKPHGIF